mgnify:CR=1 FL=1
MVTANSGPLDVSGISLKPVKSVEDLTGAVCREVYGYWERLRSSGKFAAFDLIAVPDVIPYLVFLDLEDDAPTFRFRMSGQAIVVASSDLTGQLLDKTGTVAPLTLQFCEAVAETMAPVFSKDKFAIEFTGLTRRFSESVAVPLLDGNVKLSCILLVHCPEV